MGKWRKSALGREGVYRAGLQRIVSSRNRLAGVFGKAKVCQAKLTCMTQKSLPFASGFVLSNRDFGSIAHFEKRALPNGLWWWSDSFVDEDQASADNGDGQVLGSGVSVFESGVSFMAVV